MAIADYTVPQTLIVALTGLGIIFAALGVLIILMKGLTSASKPVAGVAEASLPTAAPEPAQPAQAENMVPAQGSLGEVALYGVDDKTAALVMAIVADELQTPLNQLRFRSIRERS